MYVREHLCFTVFCKKIMAMKVQPSHGVKKIKIEDFVGGGNPLKDALQTAVATYSHEHGFKTLCHTFYLTNHRNHALM